MQPGRSTQQHKLSHWKASFLRQRCGSTRCLFILSLIHEDVGECCPVFRDKQNQSLLKCCPPLVEKQSRKTHLTWSLPISSLLCPHRFYLEIHNSHDSCPLRMVSGKCSSPQISTPDISFLCQLRPHTGKAKPGTSRVRSRGSGVPDEEATTCRFVQLTVLLQHQQTLMKG